MKTFYEIQNDVCLKFDFDITDTTTAFASTLGQIKSYINTAQEIVYSQKMEWMKKQGYISILASYSTGTLTATNKSKTLTGSGTTFTRDMVGQKIIITDDTDGNVVYRIKSFTSSTSLTLETAYIHTGGAGLSYEIYYDTYTLPLDFQGIEKMKDVEILETYFNDDDYLLSSSTTSNVPSEAIILGVKDSSYYETGTVSITIALTAVTGVGTAFDSTMVERYIQIGNYGKLYEITEVGGATSITIGKGFGGATVSGGTFKIDPPGLYQIRFHSAPDTAKLVPYTYWTKAVRLQDNGDISPIPSESVLSLGAIWLWYKNEDLAQQTQAKQDFEEEIARLAVNRVSDKQQSMTPIFE